MVKVAVAFATLLIVTSGARAEYTQWMVDLSSNNAAIKVTADLRLGKDGVPVKMIIHRATLGKYAPPAHKADALLARRASEAYESGIHFGAYHVAYPTADVAIQAQGFLARVKEACVVSQPIVLALDWEHVCVKWKDKSKGLCAEEGIVPPSFAVEFLESVEKQTGVTPILYTSVRALKTFAKYLQSDADLATRLERFPLWLARYHGKGGEFYFPHPRDHLPWLEWTFWQFAEGKGAGPTKRVALSIQDHPVDTNFYNGPRSEIDLFASKHGWRCEKQPRTAAEPRP